MDTMAIILLPPQLPWKLHQGVGSGLIQICDIHVQTDELFLFLFFFFPLFIVLFMFEEMNAFV